MHFAIRYLTRYVYGGPVSDNLNALRVKPATTANQRVDDFGVRVEPQTRLHQHLDYFDTTVIEFGISKPHDHLAIDVRARVATQDAARSRRRARGPRSRSPPTAPPAPSSCSPTPPSPTTCASTSWSARSAPTRRWARSSAACI